MFIGQFVSTPLSIHMKVGGCNQPKAQHSEDLKHWRLAQLGILGSLTSCMEKEKGRMGGRKRRERGRMWDRRERMTEREKGREDERETDRRERGEREAGRSCFTLEPCLGNHVTSFLPHSICSGSQGLTWIQGDGLSLTGSTFWEWSDKKNMWELKY